MIVTRKNTRITMLYSDTSDSIWYDVNNIDHVDQLLQRIREELGPSGTQSGRRWFHRVRDEIYYSKVDINETSWKQVPRVRYWCDIYFRDPRDATWIELKRL